MNVLVPSGLDRFTSHRSNNPHVLTVQRRIPVAAFASVEFTETRRALSEKFIARDRRRRPLVPSTDADVIVPIPGWFDQRARVVRMHIQNALLRLGMIELTAAVAWNRSARKRLERRIAACH